jgi:hypothetical protein
MSLNEYIEVLNRAIQRLDDYGLAELIEFNSELRAEKKAVINIKIIFINKSTLYIREYLNGKYGIERIDYAYQYQTEEGTLIFRYDNAKHKPALGFNEHKHTQNGSLIPRQLPPIDEIVDEVMESLS